MHLQVQTDEWTSPFAAQQQTSPRPLQQELPTAGTSAPDGPHAAAASSDEAMAHDHATPAAHHPAPCHTTHSADIGPLCRPATPGRDPESSASPMQETDDAAIVPQAQPFDMWASQKVSERTRACSVFVASCTSFQRPYYHLYIFLVQSAGLSCAARLLCTVRRAALLHELTIITNQVS